MLTTGVVSTDERRGQREERRSWAGNGALALIRRNLHSCGRARLPASKKTQYRTRRDPCRRTGQGPRTAERRSAMLCRIVPLGAGTRARALSTPPAFSNIRQGGAPPADAFFRSSLPI